MTHRMNALLLGAVLSMLAAMPAAAQCPPGARRTLTDASGNRWDFNAGGTALTAADGAFDGLATAFINGTRMEPTDFDSIVNHPDGRTFTFRLTPVGGVLLQRIVYVPNDRSFVRWIDQLQGTDGSMSTSVRYELQTNTGYDADFFDTTFDDGEVLMTSDGDAMLEATDRWYTLDNVLRRIPEPDGPLTETAPRAICEVHWAPGGTLAPTLIAPGTSYGCGGAFNGDREGVTVRYMVTIPPATRVAIMHFAVQGSRATVNAACPNLGTIDDEMHIDESLYGDLDNDLREEIINFQIPITEGACSGIGDCEPGDFCVDGFCCATACPGGPNDCQACSIAAGGTENGVCTPIALGRTCRGATGPCDRPERCDGVSSTCPANLIEPSSVACRGAVSACDVPEFCTGTSVLCPSDRLAFAGTVCRASLGDCQPASRCDGTTTACPAAVTAPDGVPCDDGIGCTYASCSGGFCTSSSGTCDDGDICTTDSCAGTTCTNAYMSGCVGGRDAGAGFDGGGGSMNFPDVPMDVGVTFDEDAPGFDAPYDGPLPWDQDADPEFDGGPFFDAGGGLRDGEVPMDGSMTADVEDRAEVTGGGCMCRAGAQGPGTMAGGASLLLLGLLIRRRR